MEKRKIVLSSLWIFVLINMIYADILSLMDPSSPIRSIMTGEPVPTGGLLAGAILMETAVVMIILSLVLRYKANRWVTSVMCVINTFAVITGGHGSYYLFFASAEVLCLGIIFWMAWTKPKQEDG